ncbi:transient receptor potential cation channel subfamily M member 1-like [Hydractinia symbiolongicarpus]|uniref:transient receptor potential cation channel subfamily M member 1-like n=1 Tax=Hydractinia symbiolongicarpus TaxID=13093 RepID=UPI00254ACC29|nr:transient receptor potential cation channel subfamily M member 1-like [Hydractinia symbiolongicarpus]
MRTNAFGDIELGNRSQRRPKYIRVGDFTDTSKVLHMMKTDWELQEVPNLIVSIIGGGNSFQINTNLHAELEQGLRKIATKTRSWIITGGTDAGVMKFVGTALKDESDENVRLLGICTWGVISGREVLVNKGGRASYPPEGHNLVTEDIALEKNHTHFILVDGGKVRQFRQEMFFRSMLEQKIMKWQIDSAAKGNANVYAGDSATTGDKHFAPAIQIVIGGGQNTIKQVLLALNSHKDNPSNLIMPVVVVKGSGRAADILAHAYTLNLSEWDTHTGAGAKEDKTLKTYTQTLMPGMSDSEQRRVISDTKMCMHMKDYITIYDPNKDGDFDEAVLLALMKVNNHKEDKHSFSIPQLKLAMSWNRAHIAQKYIFADNIKISQNLFVEDMMMDALTEGKHEFVKLLVDNCFNMEMFLKPGKLSELYDKTFPKLETITKKLFYPKDWKSDACDKGLELKDVHYGLRKLLEMDVVPHYEKNGELEVFNELFIWAVCSNFHELALYLWSQDDESLAKALVARKLSICLASKYNKYQKEEVANCFISNAEDFGQLALQLLDECASKDELKTMKLLKYPLKRWGNQDCMSLAAASQLEEFIAHYACQKVLSERWRGGISFFKSNETLQVWLGIILFPLILYYVEINEAKSQYNDGNKMMAIKRWWHKSKLKLSNFYAAPVTKFWLNFICYLIFLLLFCNFVTKKLQDRPSTVEWIVLVFLVSLGTEEIRQVCQVPNCINYKHKVKVWWSMHWNKSDLVGVVVFFLAFALRFGPSLTLKKVAHIVYAFDIMVWIVRLLDICAISKILGPYVLMVQKMTVDVMNFLIILSVFLLSYGIARYAILLPQDDFSWSSFRHMITIPYFEMYSEVFFETTAKQNETLFGTRYGEDSSYSQPIVLFILAVYLILTNILLFNLLIAIFNNTYNTVQTNSERIWRFQRYYLVDEYYGKPAFPIPFILINHFEMLIMWLISKCKDRNKSNTYKNGGKDESVYELLRLETKSRFCCLEKREKRILKNPDEKLDYIRTRVEKGKERLKKTEDELVAIKETLIHSTKLINICLKRIENKPLAAKKVVTRLSSNRDRTNSNAMLTKQMQKLLTKAMDQTDGERVNKPNSPCTPSAPKEESSHNIFTRQSLTSLNEEESNERCHVLSRCSRYPCSEIKRVTVDDRFVSWKVPLLDYEPQWYIAPNVLPGLPEVDGEFDKVDHAVGLPLNPVGRTGLTGRGLLRSYGPNHITEAIFTRFKDSVDPGNDRPQMEVLVIERDIEEFYLPSDMVTESNKPIDQLPRILRELFNSRTLRDHQVSDKRIFSTMAALNAVIRNRIEVFRGYLDDQRNTDNAWIETSVYNYMSDDRGNSFTAFFIPEEKAQKLHLKWVDMNENTPLMNDRIAYLEFVAKIHGADFSENDDYCFP